MQKNVEVKAFIFAELFKTKLKFTFFAKNVSFMAIICAMEGWGYTIIRHFLIKNDKKCRKGFSMPDAHITHSPPPTPKVPKNALLTCYDILRKQTKGAWIKHSEQQIGTRKEGI